MNKVTPMVVGRHGPATTASWTLDPGRWAGEGQWPMALPLVGLMLLWGAGPRWGPDLGPSIWTGLTVALGALVPLIAAFSDRAARRRTIVRTVRWTAQRLEWTTTDLDGVPLAPGVRLDWDDVHGIEEQGETFVIDGVRGAHTLPGPTLDLHRRWLRDQWASSRRGALPVADPPTWEGRGDHELLPLSGRVDPAPEAPGRFLMGMSAATFAFALAVATGWEPLMFGGLVAIVALGLGRSRWAPAAEEPTERWLRRSATHLSLHPTPDGPPSHRWLWDDIVAIEGAGPLITVHAGPNPVTIDVSTMPWGSVIDLADDLRATWRDRRASPEDRQRVEQARRQLQPEAG